MKPAPDHLARATFVHALARSTRQAPAAIFADRFPEDLISPAVFNKSAAPIGATDAPGFAEELIHSTVGSFLASLAPLSAAAALMRGPNALKVDVTETHAAWRIPQRASEPVTMPWIAEADPIPIRASLLDTVNLGPAAKVGAMAVLSREAMQRTNADRVFAQALREDAALSLDAAVFGTTDGGGAGLPGLLNGVTETPGSGDPRRDMKALAAAVSTGGSGQVAFIAGPATAAALNLDATIRAQILPTLAMPETRLAAVDPLSLVWGSDAEPSLEVTNQAEIHMEDTSPEAISTTGSPNTVAAPVRSLWQTDAIASRLILEIAFAKRRAGAAAFIDGVDYLS